MSKSEFNKLMIQLEVTDQDVRKIVIKSIYSSIREQEISFQQFAQYFNLLPEHIAKSQTLEIDQNIDPSLDVLDKLVPEVAQPKVLSSTDSHQGHRLTHSAIQGKPVNRSIISESGQDEFLKAMEPFPNAMKVYIKRSIKSYQYQYFHALQTMLQKKITFADPNNPSASEKTIYQPVYNILPSILGQNYYLFQQPVSVMVREQSRIQLARSIEPKDVKQGKLGNCYYLSCIAAIAAQYPEIIHSRFQFKENDSNYFVAKLFVDGEWVYIATDDRFPCVKKCQTYSPWYCRPHHNEIWVMLLEKCWAKVFGSYEATDYGVASQAFRVLTGAPCKLISLERISMLEEKAKIKQLDQILPLFKQKKSGFIACVASSNYLDVLPKQQIKKLGLTPGHAYSLLRVIEVEAGVEGKTLLVRIRNPWSKSTWTGDWSFNSDKWTPALRIKHNYIKDRSDGSFYMRIDNFLKYFDSMVICKVNTQYYHNSIRFKSNRHKSAYFSLFIRKAGKYTITIYQPMERRFRKQNLMNLKSQVKDTCTKQALESDSYLYSRSRLIILSRQGKKVEYFGSHSTAAYQDCSVEGHFEVGEYMVSAKVEWKYWQDYQFVLTSYGEDLTTFEPLERSIAPIFKEKMIESYVAKSTNPEKVYSLTKNIKVEANFSQTTGIGFIRIINNMKVPIIWDVLFKKEQDFKGLKAIKPAKSRIVQGKSSKVYGYFVSTRYRFQPQYLIYPK